MVADTLAILGSGYLTYDAVVVYSLSQNLYLAAVVFIWVTTLFLMNFGDLYRYETATHPLRHLPTVVIALVTSFLFLLAAAFSIKLSDTFSRLWLGYFAVTSGAVDYFVSCWVIASLVRLLHVRGSKRSLAIVGSGEQSRRLVALLAQGGERPVRIQGVFADDLPPVDAPHCRARNDPSSRKRPGAFGEPSQTGADR